MSSPVVINCRSPDWKKQLKGSLQDGFEVELTNFDYTFDGVLCETLATNHRMIFKLNAPASIGYFRKEQLN